MILLPLNKGALKEVNMTIYITDTSEDINSFKNLKKQFKKGAYIHIESNKPDSDYAELKIKYIRYEKLYLHERGKTERFIAKFRKALKEACESFWFEWNG